VAEQVWEKLWSNLTALRRGALSTNEAEPLDVFSQEADRTSDSTPPSVPAVVVNEHHVRTILASGLFDATFYAQQSGCTQEPVACVSHYLVKGVALGLLPNRLFSPTDYLATHTDVAQAGMDPFLHYVSSGIEEGRQIVVPDETLSALRRLPLELLLRQRVLQQARSLGFDPAQAAPPETIAVYASSLGNFFFRQIADRVATGFRASGHRVYRLDQNCRRPDDVTLDFVVAPHEFFLLGAGPGWLTQIELARSIVFNTEQPGTPWYFRSLRYAFGAGTLVDLSPQSATLVPALGFPSSGFLPLGPVAGSQSEERELLRDRVDGLEDVPLRPAADRQAMTWAERPIDILFLGTLTERRSKALASLASTLANYRCFVHAPTGFGGPLRGAKGQIDETHSRWLASRAKILLNIHRGEFPYFEWHRVVMLGAEQGTIVLSEPSLPVPGIQPDRHFLSSHVEGMPAIINRLLGDEGPVIAEEMTFRCRQDLAEHLELGVELRALTFLHRRRVAARA
jgi:hypothetical protein